MARQPTSSSAGETFTCPRCKDEFLTYSITDAPVCPRCRQPVKARLHRRTARAAGLLVFGLLVVVGLVAYYVISQR